MEKLHGELASQIAAADKLLIVAAAGLSISIDEPNNVYHSRTDFKLHYPLAVQYGYGTAYEAMGFGRDERIPVAVRKAYMCRHFLNMRFNFQPTVGYKWLKSLTDTFPSENTFVWTSNVDGCFERSGFDPTRVYTTQGEMNRLQCANPGCGHVWNCEHQLRAVDVASPNGILTDMSLVPMCPSCGSVETLPNLRGGNWFIHAPYKEVSLRLLQWLDICVSEKAKIAIIEVGVGPNTPIVTRIPACAFASAVAANGGSVMYLRVNPDKVNFIALIIS
jgi:NAD-dependent SIR2 family protein deacetylase